MVKQWLSVLSLAVLAAVLGWASPAQARDVANDPDGGDEIGVMDDPDGGDEAAKETGFIKDDPDGGDEIADDPDGGDEKGSKRPRRMATESSTISNTRPVTELPK